MIGRACDFLAEVAKTADAGGAVPPAFPVIESFPRAAHWTEWTYAPALNPTAGLVGLLHKLGADHPWRAEAEAWCWKQLESGQAVRDAHTLSEVLGFLANVPDQDRAERLAAQIASGFADVAMLQLDAEATDYGLTPLALAPEAGSRWRVRAVHRGEHRRAPGQAGGQPAARRRLADQVGTAERRRAGGMARDRHASGDADPDLLRPHESLIT